MNLFWVLVVGGLAVLLHRYRQPNRISRGWLRDTERRSWSVGLDQVSFKGPFRR